MLGQTFIKWLKGKNKTLPNIVLASVILYVITSLTLVSKELVKDNLSAIGTFFENNYTWMGAALNFAFVLYVVFFSSQKIKYLTCDGDALTRYARKRYGPDAYFSKIDGSFLKDAVNKTVDDIAVRYNRLWLFWIGMYIILLPALANTENIDIKNLKESRVFDFITNFISNCTTILLILMYRLVTNKTIKKDHGKAVSDLRAQKWYVALIIITLLDAYVVFGMSGDAKKTWEFIIMLIVAIMSTISFMALLGRLNSKFINIPSWLMIIMYMYATVQMFYPFDEKILPKEIFGNAQILTVTLYTIGVIFKVYFFYMMNWMLETGRLTYYVLNEGNLNRDEDNNFGGFLDDGLID